MRATINLIVMAAFVGISGAAVADETGLAGIHSWHKVGSRTCFEDHFHDGSGTGATQNAAMTDAIKSWQSFTALEYGSAWAAYNNSVSKSAKCDRSTTGFTCSVSSIPCKGGAIATKRAR